MRAPLGLISREDSSGPCQRLGSITKAGNSHGRHVVVRRRGATGTGRRPASTSSADKPGNRPR